MLDAAFGQLAVLPSTTALLKGCRTGTCPPSYLALARKREIIF